MLTVRTLAKGQVVIPAQMRKRLSIDKGSLLQVTLVEDHIELRPLPHDPIETFCGSLPAGDSLARELMDEHRRETEHDDKG